jgi:hypothetical protein
MSNALPIRIRTALAKQTRSMKTITVRDYKVKPTILSYFQNSLSSSYNAPYTNLMLRNGMNDTATVDFGDTEYTFKYYYYNFGDISYLTVSTSIWDENSVSLGYNNYVAVHEGDTYTDFGVEAKISKIASDYISNYIVILVKPVIQNYGASLHYTRLNITLNQPDYINISSDLSNETHQYIFTFTQITYAYNVVSQITIETNSQQKTYPVSEGYLVEDLNIVARIYNIESSYMVIYVKPQY